MSFAMDMGGVPNEGTPPQHQQQPGGYSQQGQGYAPQQPGVPMQAQGQGQRFQGGQGGYNPNFGNMAGAAAAQFMGGDGKVGGAVGAMAAQFGQQHYDKATEAVGKMVDVQRVKYYFTVDTACIRKKMQLLMFPFLPSINWQRVSKEGKTLPPKDDPIAPDLYIPVMAFLTYVLTIGLALGTSGKFTPEQLGIMLSSQLGWTAFEVFLCFAGLWFMDVPHHPLLELIAFCSYKFVGMVWALLAYVVTASTPVSSGVLLYNGIATGTVLVQTLRNNSGDDPSTKKKVLYFSLALAGFQLLMMVWSFSQITTMMEVSEVVKEGAAAGAATTISP